MLALTLGAAVPCAAQTGNPPADTTAAPVIQAPPTPPSPPDYPRGRISGYMFGDLYYNLDGDPTHVYSAAGGDAGQINIDGAKPITQDLNGIQLRRVYFQLDNDLSYKYSTRFRLEMDSQALTSNGKIGAFVKNAYLQAKSVVPRGDFFFGMINTPTFENAEEFWGYRSIEKTIADFRGLASSSDIGVSMKGFADPDHRLGYTAMIGDGTTQRPETDRFKRFYFTLPIRVGELRVEPYADYQSMRVNLQPKVPTNTDSLAVNNDQLLWKVFAGYGFRRVNLGLEAVTQVRHKGPAPTQEPRGYSIFANSTLTPTLAAFARFDHWEPDHRADNRVDNELYIAGVDWQPFRDVHVMPNLEASQFRSKGIAVAPPHNDLQARITFYYRFSRPQS
jgi:hypothetical protein